MEIPRQRRKPISVELSPLIDCIFLLLVFFMLSSSFLTPAIRMTLPSASGEPQTERKPIFVTLDADGQVYLNKKQVSMESLPAELGALLLDADEKSVTVRGDEEMEYKHFVQVLDIAKQCGAVHVNVAHQVKD